MYTHFMLHDSSVCVCVCLFTSGVDACVDVHLGVTGDHAGPPGVGTHFGPHQVPHLVVLIATCTCYHCRVLLLDLQYRRERKHIHSINNRQSCPTPKTLSVDFK